MGQGRQGAGQFITAFGRRRLCELNPRLSQHPLSPRERVRVREAATLVERSLTPALSRRERGKLADVDSR